MIEVRNLSFHYPKCNENVLTDVSFTVHKGEWLTIIGKNGSGKSTLIKILNGLLLPTSGRIIVEGLEVTNENLRDIRKRIGMVFQNPENQFVGMTVFDDLAFGMENFQIPKEEMLRRINWVLEAMDICDLKYKAPQDLSGGQKQHIAVAGILTMRPAIIVLDEATSMLDPKGKENFIHLLKKLNKDYKITIVSVTHELSELEFSDRTLAIENGAIVSLASSKHILGNRALRAKYKLGDTFMDRFYDALIEQQFPISSSDLSASQLVEDICQLFLKK